MDFKKFKEILNTCFSKKEIEDLLGHSLFNSIIEWSNSEDSYTQSSLVDLLVSINGFGLFQRKDFRTRFFQSVPISDLQNLLGNSSSDYTKLAQIAAKYDFANNDFYNALIHSYFNCPDYDFLDNSVICMQELVSGTQEKFYELFDYQYLIKQQAIYELCKDTPIGRKILIHMPTGTGKTKTTMHILTYYLNFINKDSLILWVAHTNELLTQALDTFRNVWGHLGLKDIQIERSWGEGVHKITWGIYFTTIQSLMSMKKRNISTYHELCKQTSLMVYDECHKIGAAETNAIVKDFTDPGLGVKKYFIGLTATPGRTTEESLENRIFNEFFDRKIEIDVDVVDRISMGKNQAINSKNSLELIPYFQKRKILSKLQKEQLEYIVPQDLIEEITKEANARGKEDFSPKLIEKIAHNKARNTVILHRLIELNRQEKPTIVFACSLDHAKMLSAFLNIENIPNVLVYGEMLPSMRKQAIEDFKSPDSPVNIIINYDILTTGFDSTNIECVFITRPTKSVILYSQMVGRGLRGPLMGGGETCLLIDVKDNLDLFNENKAFSHFNSYWR